MYGSGVGGFENCPFTPNCPILKELMNQQVIVHSSFAPRRFIRIKDDEAFVNNEREGAAIPQIGVANNEGGKNTLTLYESIY